MRRGLSGRAYSAAKVVAVLVLALATGACARGAETTSRATPIPGDADLSFADLMSVKPSPSPSASPSASPTSTDTGTKSSSSTNRSRPSSGGAPAAAQAASGPANCPSGRVTGEFIDFTVSKVRNADPAEEEEAMWRVQATGQVLNETARPVRDIRVTVTVHADSAETDSEGTTIGGWVGRGTSADWRVVFEEYESKNEPDEDDVRVSVSGWSWGEGALAQCPTPGWSS